MRARLHRPAALIAALVLGATVVTAPGAAAEEVDPLAPVVVDDELTLWPGQQAEIDVLANDSDPGGDDLAFCRLPPLTTADGELPVSVWDRSRYDGSEGGGILQVAAAARARGTYVVDYYVCNHTRLTPAHLTVTFRPVQPVDVVADRVPDRILVTNHNDRTIRFIATDRRGCKIDVSARVGAGETRSFRVRRHVVSWIAGIGRGVADLGTVRGIELTGPPAPPGPQHQVCAIFFGRQGPGIGASGS